MGRKRREDGCKMLPCHKCCPANAASNYKLYNVSHEWDVESWEAEPVVWGWRCCNCGNFKKPRAKRETASSHYAMEVATSDAKLSVRNALLFHYFNPHGCVAMKRKMDKRIDRAIDDTGCPNGVLFVHGGLSNYHTDKLSKLISAKSVKSFDVWYHIGKIKEGIVKAEAWLVETYAKHGLPMPPAEEFEEVK